MLNARSNSHDASSRTQRIKNISTRSGPAPVVNSESWNLVNQQGCCVFLGNGCSVLNCSRPITYRILSSPSSGVYEFLGVLDPDDNTVKFNIAEVTSNCDKPDCDTIKADDFTVGPIQFICEVGKGCLTNLRITTTTTTSFSITYVSFGIYASNCGSGGLDPDETITIKLTYNAGP